MNINHAYPFWFIGFIGAILLNSACLRPTTLVDQAAEQLPMPELTAEQLFFYEKTNISALKPPPGNSQIYYTTDGSIPNKDSPVLTDKLEVRKTSFFLFRAISETGLTSESVALDVFQVFPNKLSFAQGHTPAAPYHKEAQNTLTDTRKASKDYQAGGWWGYPATEVNLTMDMKRTTVHGLALSFLEDQTHGIFCPTQVRVAFYDAMNNLLAYVEKDYPASQKTEGVHFRFLRLPTPTIYPTQVVIEISCMPTLPDWHPNTAEQAWLLLDEVLVW